MEKEYHKSDIDAVLRRAWESGVQRIIITAGSLPEARTALSLATTDDRLFCTVGCHPTRCKAFDEHPGGPAAYLEELWQLVQEAAPSGKVVAIGECGLDYERLQFCDAQSQRRGFEMQFELSRRSGLPMFLHLRGAADDFLQLVQAHASDFPAAVVHSFDGTRDELERVLALPQLHVGINGCSLKTEANLEVAAAVPAGRLLLETDAPWCEIRSTHAGKRHVTTEFAAKDRKKHDSGCMVKSRNEPCTIRCVGARKH